MVTLLAALLLAGPHTADRPSTDIRPWVLTVKRDSFTGVSSCSARAPHVRLDGDRLSLDVGREVQPTEAAYRLDGGPVQRLSSLASDGAYRESFHFDPERDARLVFFKTADLAGVQTLSVRPDARHAVATFDLSALPRVIDAEKSAGCGGL